MQQLYAIVDAIQPRYRGLVLLATFASLRWGELVGLRRRHIDLQSATVRVEQATAEVPGHGLITGPPKTPAGRRTVAFPTVISPIVSWHLQCFAEPGPNGRVFVGPNGATPQRSNFNRIWRKATRDAGVTGLRFHDLRHTGNSLAASTGASLRELMDRMGHSSTRAAMIYQHATKDRGREIADAIGARTTQELARRRRSTHTSNERATSRPQGEASVS
jgi:integrase